MVLKNKITQYIRQHKSMTKEDLARVFEVEKDSYKDFYKTLKQMEKEGFIYKNKKDKYVAVDNKYYVKGKLQGNEKGFAFLIAEDKEVEDTYIEGKDLNSALNGDEVIVRILEEKSEKNRSRGKVIEVLKRANEIIVGTFQELEGFGFVVADDGRIGRDIFIPKGKKFNAKNGQKVVAQVEKWIVDNKNPEGKIIEVLGYPNEKGVDILSVAKAMDLPMVFNRKSLNEAKNLNTNFNVEDLSGRSDYRDLSTFTIDGKDSKDFDDAVSIELLENGNYFLGVHIADVAHYVKETSELNKEAFKRGNSVYLLDKVIPMLPEELSNGICSLNPNVDRLCLSVNMEINTLGKVVHHKIEESVINSKARLVYDHVSDFLEDNSIVHKSIRGLEEPLLHMEKLAAILRKKRLDRGSIDFDFPEMHIELNENGVPINISRLQRRVANKLIEEFMLVCNETVAEHYFWLEIPFIYRIHEDPNEEKIAALNKSIRTFGYRIKSVKEVSPRDVQQIVESASKTDKEVFINTLVLRSLKKARYATQCEGHFALAAKYYTHFTSPIRRFGDLEIHRIIKDFINNNLSNKKIDKLNTMLPNITERISETERLAQDAERTVMDLKSSQYMENKIGEVYLGFISSVTRFGIFVQLENTIEGLVSYSKMPDYFTFDEENYKAMGEMSKIVYTLGDKVKVKVTGVDSQKGTIDFMIVSDNIE